MRMPILAVIVLALAVAVFFWLRHGGEDGGEARTDPTEVISGQSSNEKEAWSVWNDHTARKIFSRAAEDIVWDFMADPGEPGEDQGRETVLKLFEEEFEKPFPDGKLIIMRRFVFDKPLIIDELWTSGVHVRDYQGFAATGQRVGSRALWFRWYEDGRLKKLISYSDRLTTILRQIKKLPPSAGVVPEVPPLPTDPNSFEVIEGQGDPKRIEAIRAAYAAFGKPDKSAVKTLYTAETLFRDIAENVETKGVDKHLEQQAAMEKAFPKMSAEVVQAFAIGDYVITRVVWKGAHDGPLGNFKATGKQVEVHQAQVFRFQGQKVVDVSSYSSTLDFIRQLDPLMRGTLTPSPPRSKNGPGYDPTFVPGPTRHPTLVPGPVMPGTKPQPKREAPPGAPPQSPKGPAGASASPSTGSDEGGPSGGGLAPEATTDAGQPQPGEAAPVGTTEDKAPQPGKAAPVGTTEDSLIED